VGKDMLKMAVPQTAKMLKNGENHLKIPKKYEIYIKPVKTR
jgi:hypothetical protein